MIGSVLQYRRNSQSLQSRVRSCLHATVNTQPVQLRTKTESTQAAMNTLRTQQHGGGGRTRACVNHQANGRLRIRIITGSDKYGGNLRRWRVRWIIVVISLIFS